MALVRDAMDDAALECAVKVPSSWIAATTQRTYQELFSILAIAADELLDRVDWPDPITVDTTLTGTAVENYDLPSDFKRLTHDEYCVYETTTTRRFGIPVTSNGEWTNLKQLGSAGGYRYYRLSGDDEDGWQLGFYRPLETGTSVTVSYVSRNWLKKNGTAADTWENDTDTLMLPKRLLTLGVVWRWKKRKGLPYATDMAEYEARLARAANEHRGIRKITFGQPLNQRAPWDVPVPDFIPSS